MATVKWRPRAVADLGRLHDFLYDKDSRVAGNAARVISQSVSLLETSPHIGRPMHDETGRRELVISFGAGAYVLRYMLEKDETVVVLRIWHNRENR